MKISTRLRLAVYVPTLMAFVIGAALIFSYQETAKIQENGDVIRQIRSSITELNHSFFSYTLSHGERAKQQFLAEHEKLTGMIAEAKLSTPDQQRLLGNIHEYGVTMKNLFLQIVYAYEDGDTGGGGRPVGRATPVKFISGRY